MGNSNQVISDGFNDKIVNGFENDLIAPTQKFINPKPHTKQDAGDL